MNVGREEWRGAGRDEESPTIRAGVQASPLEFLPGATDPRGVQKEPRTRPSKSRAWSDSDIPDSVRLLQGEGEKSRREGGVQPAPPPPRTMPTGTLGPKA